MITVLGEYKVSHEKNEEFLALLPQVKASLEEIGASQIRFFEGTDQPGLYVEEFLVADMQAYEVIKKLRHEEKSEVWKQFHSYILGGKDKVHIWAFTQLNHKE